MFFYFECQSCKKVSDLIPESELPDEPAQCSECSKKFGPSNKVERIAVNYYIFHCRKCDYTSGMCSALDYPTQKGIRPRCPKCAQVDDVYFVKPHVRNKPERLKKRKHPGVLPPDEVTDLGLYQTEDLEKTANEELLQAIKKTKRTLFPFQQEDDQVRLFTLGSTSSSAKLARSESRYQEKKKFRKAFNKRFGELSDARDPMKTTMHVGTPVPFTQYQSDLGHSENINGVTYPKMSKSSPVVVNGAKLVDRSLTWDYRELGPNSFLRRLCSLVYVVEFNGGGDSNNPVEVQAMWAHGSLFLSTNNYTFSKALLEALQSDGSVAAFLDKLKLPGLTTGSYDTSLRNFGNEHKAKLGVYRDEIVKNTYPDYFRFKWEYVFSQMRLAMRWSAANIRGITVLKDKTRKGYPFWSVDSTVETGKIYVVLPKALTKGEGQVYFTKKKIHAEQLFYPILMQLNGASRISLFQPAFIGGVKTPCRTCYEVLQDASRVLGDKLILPTDAFGHYWGASGMHVPNTVFPSHLQTLVFGAQKSIDEGSINIYNTEMPPSPKHDDEDD
ncbi:hypothetical protein DRW03_09515 [Corallococcus sp. H22C18031201]|uniref:hypothetical protein n=1 Tax=Citreicoccus inhibens TaxID=2849499 RepID=UPI000E76FBD0|nr:hypothetical protein [Citreicoccus inhibens]MBU8895855.1 hypothetical protein [Citreicoccus inhibens]RJS23863.1 hypothetical protein DRW03_09515 [Corallococcus sp. H22C18031201]